MPEITAESGFEEFYERNYKLVYRICFTYMKNKSEAEDCTEDVFVKVLSGNEPADKIQGCNLSPLLYGLQDR